MNHARIYATNISDLVLLDCRDWHMRLCRNRLDDYAIRRKLRLPVSRNNKTEKDGGQCF